jgi:hypothetical protein
MPDPELEAMAQVQVAFEPLDAEARGRVLAWIASRFDLDHSGVAPPSGRDEDAEVGEAPAFSEIGDLMHASGASTGPQRALVAGYWFQVVHKQPGFGGGEINGALKDLGHGLANVTKTLESLKAKKPALVLQIQKTGRSRQARKTYKLTVEGVRVVDRLLEGAGADL